MRDELISLVDALKTDGADHLVDFDRGFAEEQIENLYAECVNLLNDDIPHADPR